MTRPAVDLPPLELSVLEKVKLRERYYRAIEELLIPKVYSWSTESQDAREWSLLVNPERETVLTVTLSLRDGTITGFRCNCHEGQRKMAPGGLCKHVLAVALMEGWQPCGYCLRWAAPHYGEIICPDCKIRQGGEAARDTG